MARRFSRRQKPKTRSYRYCENRHYCVQAYRFQLRIPNLYSPSVQSIQILHVFALSEKKCKPQQFSRYKKYTRRYIYSHLQMAIIRLVFKHKCFDIFR